MGRGLSPIIARLLVFFLCVVMARLVLKFAVVGLLSSVWPHDQMDELAGLLDMELPYQTPVTGDGPRQGEMPEDLQRAGQVVRRNGELVILVDDSDPEVYIPLNNEQAALVGVHPILRADPFWLSVGMGSVFFVGLMLVSWRYGPRDPDDPETVAETTPKTTNKPPETPHKDGISW